VTVTKMMQLVPFCSTKFCK